MSAWSRARGWLDERLDLGGIEQALSRHRVPAHRWSAFNVLGGLTLVLLGVLVASGILLLLYYRPSVEEAHRSVSTIMSEVPYGNLVRSVHVWSADLFVASMVAHVFVVVIGRGYRSPRELIWLTGGGLLVVGVGEALSGSLLPWSQGAYVSARVSTELAARVPLVGHFLRVFLRGGEEVTATSLTRFFGFHAAILPAAMTALVAAHLGMVVRQGVSVPSSLEGRSVRMVPYWPAIALRDQARATLLLLVVLSLAILVPRELGTRADPFAPAPAHARPEWYFLWVFQLIRGLPPRLLGLEADRVAVALLVGALGAFVALPWLDRRGSRAMLYVGLAGLAGFVGATIHGLR
jgi:quinol-cytochrome oxidoreductase complex cytochrome b subunit